MLPLYRKWILSKRIGEKSLLFNKVFQDLNTKAIIMNGYLRTNQKLPALERLNEQVALTIYDFMEFLENIGIRESMEGFGYLDANHGRSHGSRRMLLPMEIIRSIS